MYLLIFIGVACQLVSFFAFWAAWQVSLITG